MQPLRKPAKAPAPVKKQLQQETQKADEYALFGPVPIEGCPQCNQKIGMNPNMRMFVGPCYHRMCGACVDKFFKHRSRCPVSGCSFQLRRVDMKPQRFEDLSVQRDAEVRKEFSEIFNKRQEDFKDLCEYNDYLQWTEDMIFDLIHGSKTDQANAKAQIEIYKKENAELIAHNSLLQAREKTLTESILMSEKAQRLKNRQFYADMHDSEDRQRREEKERLLEAMWRGENVSNAALAGAGVDISKRVFQLLPKAPLVPEAREVEVAKSKLQELKTGATGVGTGGALVSAPATHWADSPFDSEYEQEDEYLEGSPSLPSHPLKEPSAATEGLRYYDLTVQGIRKDKAYTKKDGQVAWAGGWAPEMWWGKAVGEVYQGLFLGIGTA